MEVTHVLRDLILLPLEVCSQTESSAVDTPHLVLGAFQVFLQPESSAASQNFAAKYQNFALTLCKIGTTVL